LPLTRARGRNGGRKPKMTPAKLRLAQAAVGKRGTVVADLCEELGISSQTLTGTSPLRAGYGSKERK
jgi:lambda repressor-like predicted transcriptional regulator